MSRRGGFLDSCHFHHAELEGSPSKNDSLSSMFGFYFTVLVSLSVCKIHGKVSNGLEASERGGSGSTVEIDC